MSTFHSSVISPCRRVSLQSCVSIFSKRYLREIIFIFWNVDSTIMPVFFSTDKPALLSAKRPKVAKSPKPVKTGKCRPDEAPNIREIPVIRGAQISSMGYPRGMILFDVFLKKAKKLALNSMEIVNISWNRSFREIWKALKRTSEELLMKGPITFVWGSERFWNLSRAGGQSLAKSVSRMFRDCDGLFTLRRKSYPSRQDFFKSEKHIWEPILFWNHFCAHSLISYGKSQ